MDEPRYKIGTVAKLTGLSPFVLRAWEIRYDLLEPQRSSTGRRAYTRSDVETLRAVKRLLDRRSREMVAGAGAEPHADFVTSLGFELER